MIPRSTHPSTARRASPERFRKRGLARGLTLIEILVAVGIFALVASLVYGAFDGLARSRDNADRVGDRYHQGRLAVARIARELQSAFLSLHQPLDQSFLTRKTAFIGAPGTPASRLDFTSFSHQRINAGTHESDQNELSYFGSPNPNKGVDLVRRESPFIDIDPQHGGVVQVLAEDIRGFDLQYLDQLNGEWQREWDSTQITEALRLPAQVRIELVLTGDQGEAVPFVTKVTIPMQNPLQFGVPK